MRSELEVRKELRELAVRLIGAIAIKDHNNTKVASKGIRKLTNELTAVGKEYRQVTSPKNEKGDK